MRGANPLIEAWAKDDPQIILLNLDAQYQNADGSLKTELFNDGIHPNDKGYRIWARELKKVMERDAVPFRRRVSQKLTGIPGGEYALSYMIDEGSGWQRRTKTLTATNGACEIVFDFTTPCRIDDVMLIKNDK